MEHIVEAFNNQGFMRLLGATIEISDPGLCSIRVANHEGLGTHHGLVHGGVIASIADTSCGFAANSLMNMDQQPLTVEFKINFVAKASGQSVIARAKVLKHGRTLNICTCEVYDVDNDSESLCATAIVTIMAVNAVAKPDK